MENGDYMERTGAPFTGERLQELKEFLRQQGLSYDDGIEWTVELFTADGAPAGTASLQGNIIKCVAVAEDNRGEGLSGRLLTAVQREAFQRGCGHLFLYTKPQNGAMFRKLGFYPVAGTDEVLMMENRKNGVGRFVESIRSAKKGGRIGAVVANCNPFTNGHRYLMETAAGQCDLLYIFVLSEGKSLFPAEVRLRLVREGTADLANAVLCPTEDYLISSATFPTYFLKDDAQADRIQCGLDLQIFGRQFAPKLGITKRFVGTEPLDRVTAAYNRRMKQVLPLFGIEVVEVERVRAGGAPVSASRVRALLRGGDPAAVRGLVPECTYRFLCSPQGRKIIDAGKSGPSH